MALGLASYSDTSFKVGTAATNPTVTSNAFSPAAGDEIYVVYFADDSSAALTENTPTTTGTLSFTLVARDNIFSSGTLAGVASVWRANSASAQTSITVTVTATSSQSAHGGIAILGFTGADSAQAGAKTATRNSTTSSTTSAVAAMTTSQVGSWCFMVGEDYTSFTTVSPASGQATQCAAQNPGSGDTVWVQKENPQPSSSRAAGTSVTMSATLGVTGSTHCVAWEVIPAGSTPTISGGKSTIVNQAVKRASLW